MNLIAKSKLLIVLFILLFVLNFILGIWAIEEFKKTNQLTGQDYVIDLHIRELEAVLFDYEISRIIAAFRNSEENIQNLLENQENLKRILSHEISPNIQSDLENHLQQVKSQIFDLVEENKDDTQNLLKTQESYLNTNYQKRLDIIHANLNKLKNQSSGFVAEDREKNIKFNKTTQPLLWIIFLSSLFFLLQALWYIRKHIILPMKTIMELLDKIKSGDFSVRWNYNRSDEIGDVGKTINLMAEGLECQRRQRLEFIGSIAHDLKNPLAVLDLSNELAMCEKDSLSKEELLKAIMRNKGQVQHMLHLTDDLLMAVRGNQSLWRIQLSTFYLADLAKEILDLYINSDSKHTYAFITDGKSTQINADRHRIGQVLNNLISNATKYSPPDTQIELSIYSTSNSVFLEVKDQGIGIPDEKKEAVFKLFNRLESGIKMSTGAGFGLAIVKDIIQSHSGTVSVLDRPGGGTIFRIELPRNIFPGSN